MCAAAAPCVYFMMKASHSHWTGQPKEPPHDWASLGVSVLWPKMTLANPSHIFQGESLKSSPKFKEPPKAAKVCINMSLVVTSTHHFHLIKMTLPVPDDSKISVSFGLFFTFQSSFNIVHMWRPIRSAQFCCFQNSRTPSTINISHHLLTSELFPPTSSSSPFFLSSKVLCHLRTDANCKHNWSQW